MEYRTIEELEIIGKGGASSFDESIGNTPVKRCRCLSSFWVCTNTEKDGIAEHLHQDGFWESWITQWISMNIKPGSVCIDAGSTYGYYTFFFAQHGCKVYSIEANRELIPLLEYANYCNGSWDRVKIINKAVYNSSGKLVSLKYSDSIGGSNIKNENDSNGNLFVETIALDELLQFEKKIDFVKLDISGSEELAWKGMQKIMQTNPSCICIMEFSPAYYNNRGKDFFESFLVSHRVAYIDYTGAEIPLTDYGFFTTDKENWRMIIIRNKNSYLKEESDIISSIYHLDD